MGHRDLAFPLAER